MSNTQYLTRQEIALMLEVSVDVVRKNEKRWGLDKHRQRLNARIVRYHRRGALVVLAAITAATSTSAATAATAK